MAPSTIPPWPLAPRRCRRTRRRHAAPPLRPALFYPDDRRLLGIRPARRRVYARLRLRHAAAPLARPDALRLAPRETEPAHALTRADRRGADRRHRNVLAHAQRIRFRRSFLR